MIRARVAGYGHSPHAHGVCDAARMERGDTYHLVLEISPGHFVGARDGALLFDVIDRSDAGGAGSMRVWTQPGQRSALEHMHFTNPDGL
jgi:hypothetical protein